MAEYVKKEDVLALADWYEEYDSDTGEETAFKYIDPLAVSNTPAADVVEVVRCRDCKWQKRDIEVEGYWICNQRVVREDDFCSYGMRKEG